jgi:tetratricopeptide (TPR) repeat protein
MDNPYAPTDAAGPPASGKVIRKVSWPATALQIAVIGAAYGVTYWLAGERGAMLTIVAYFVYSHGSRWLLTGAHRRGMRFFRAGHFEDAIAQYEQSYAFFSRHAWLDRYRALTMFSPSATSYREMALFNIANCQVRLGDRTAAEGTFRRLLKEFPDGVFAPELRQFELAKYAAA